MATKTSSPAGCRGAAPGGARPAGPALSEVVQRTPSTRPRRTTPSAKGSACDGATPTEGRTAAGRPATAAAIGSAQRAHPRSAASQPAGPPTPAPASSSRAPAEPQAVGQPAQRRPRCRYHGTPPGSRTPPQGPRRLLGPPGDGVELGLHRLALEPVMLPSRIRPAISALTAAPSSTPVRRAEAGQVHAATPATASSARASATAAAMPAATRVRRGQHPLHRRVVQVQAGEALQHPRRALVGVDGDPRDERQRRPGGPGGGDERRPPGPGCYVVEHAELRRRPAASRATRAGPQVDRRRLGRLRHRDRQPVPRGQGGQPGAVEVEHLGRRPAARRRRGRRRSRTAPRRPRRRPARPAPARAPPGSGRGRRALSGGRRARSLRGEQRRREVGPVLVLTDEHRSRRARGRTPGAAAEPVRVVARG